MNQPILHENLPLIEVSDYLTLDNLYADPHVSASSCGAAHTWWNFHLPRLYGMGWPRG